MLNRRAELRALVREEVHRALYGDEPEQPQVRATDPPSMAVTAGPRSMLLLATAANTRRSDLIVLRNEDPAGGLFEQPADPEQTDFWTCRIISGVPPGTRTWAEVGLNGEGRALALIEVRPDAKSVRDGDILDLRSGKPGTFQ